MTAPASRKAARVSERTVWQCAADRFGRLGQRGITFAEVAASMGLLTGILLIVAPVFSQLLGLYHLRGATQEIFAELQRARLAAVMENHRYRLSVESGTGTYEIHNDLNANNAVDLGEVTTHSVDIENPGVVLTADDAGVTFLPNGTALTHGTITVSHATGTKSVVVGSGGRIRTQ